MALIDNVKDKALLYLKETDSENTKIDMFPTSIADFVLEYATEKCNFPKHFTQQNIEDALVRCTNTLAMMCVHMYLKIGVEGNTSYSANGITRVFDSSFIPDELLMRLPNYVNTL